MSKMWSVWLMVTGMVCMVSAGVYDNCIPGLTIYHPYTKETLLGPYDCNTKPINASLLSSPPSVHFGSAKSNETYILMLLNTSPVKDIFFVNWLVTNISAFGTNLFLDKGMKLAEPYSPPINTTMYGFYLFNSTGVPLIYRTLSLHERQYFSPSVWLNKNSVFRNQPIAANLFHVVNKTIPPGSTYPPAGGHFPPRFPSGPPQYPPPQFPQPPPQYPHPPPQYPHPPQYPPAQYPHPPQAPPFPPRSPHFYASNYIMTINNSQYVKGGHGHNPLLIDNNLYYASLNSPGITRLTPTLYINKTIFSWKNKTSKSYKISHNINNTLYVGKGSTSSVMFFLILSAPLLLLHIY